MNPSDVYHLEALKTGSPDGRGLEAQGVFDSLPPVARERVLAVVRAEEILLGAVRAVVGDETPQQTLQTATERPAGYAADVQTQYRMEEGARQTVEALRAAGYDQKDYTLAS